MIHARGAEGTHYSGHKTRSSQRRLIRSQPGVRGAERDIGVAVAVLGVLGAGQLQQERAPAERAPPRAHLARGHLPGQAKPIGQSLSLMWHSVQPSVTRGHLPGKCG